jgi:hypothetical protein
LFFTEELIGIDVVTNNNNDEVVVAAVVVVVVVVGAELSEIVDIGDADDVAVDGDVAVVVGNKVDDTTSFIVDVVVSVDSTPLAQT